jgi:hypothetical protein
MSNVLSEHKQQQDLGKSSSTSSKVSKRTHSESTMSSAPRYSSDGGNSVADTAEYLKRIQEYAQGGNVLDRQRQTPSVLSRLTAQVSHQQLTTRPSEGKWSIAEILAHLADDEIASAWRYRQMVEHSGISLTGFDQDLWACLGDYGSHESRESIELFRLLRNANTAFLERLAPQQWECFGIHAERGRITIRDLATHMVGHDANHIEQIIRILG